MLRLSDLPGRMSATRPDGVSSTPASVRSRRVSLKRRLITGTLTGLSLVSALVVVPAATQQPTAAHAAPAAAFALASLTGMSGGMGGVEDRKSS